MKSGMRNALLMIILSAMAGSLMLYPLLAQQQPAPAAGNEVESNDSKVELVTPTDSKRTCGNRDDWEKTGMYETKKIIVENDEGSMSKDYWEALDKLIIKEKENLKEASERLSYKHQNLIHYFPKFKRYQELVVENVAGSYKNGEYVSIRKFVSFSFTSNHDLDCIVIESMIRQVDRPEIFTRRLVRIFYPDLDNIQIETLRHNFHRSLNLASSSPEVHLESLRKIQDVIDSSVFMIDMMVSQEIQNQNELIEWQTNDL